MAGREEHHAKVGELVFFEVPGSAPGTIFEVRLEADGKLHVTVCTGDPYDDAVRIQTLTTDSFTVEGVPGGGVLGDPTLGEDFGDDDEGEED